MLLTVLTIACYLFVVNTITFLLFGFDKVAAEDGRRRVPEHALLNWAFAGGTPAAYLASAVFSHKTRKISFRRSLHGIAAVQIAALAAGTAYYMFGP